MENSTNIIKVWTKTTINHECENEDDDNTHVESHSHMNVAVFTSLKEAAKEFEFASVGLGEDGNSIEIIAVTDGNDECMPIDYVLRYNDEPEEPKHEEQLEAEQDAREVGAEDGDHADGKVVAEMNAEGIDEEAQAKIEAEEEDFDNPLLAPAVSESCPICGNDPCDCDEVEE
jgi:hypothetical protein